jgi:hypothetical protein
MRLPCTHATSTAPTYRDKPDAQQTAESIRIHGVDNRLLLHPRRVHGDQPHADATEATWCGWGVA